jgi:hypothetical protein
MNALLEEGRRQERIRAAHEALVDAVGNHQGDPSLPPEIRAAWVEVKEAKR